MSRAKGAFPAVTKSVIFDRDEGRCVVTGRYLRFEEAQFHHRRPRNMGGVKGARAVETASPANGLTVSLEGHAWVESNRYEALRLGLLVPQGWQPTKTAVKHAVHGLVHLDDLGGWTPVITPF